MTALLPIPPATEMTPRKPAPAKAGGEQTLLACVPPIRLAERLALLMAAPLRSAKPQKSLDVGLWDDDARNQLNLF